jgi:4-hydroxythreonine-4-phosphate dehydrogenase
LPFWVWIRIVEMVVSLVKKMMIYIETNIKIFDKGTLVFLVLLQQMVLEVVSMINIWCSNSDYHDQGLIPFKTLSFGNGVNYTAGLSKIRPLQIMEQLLTSLAKGIADYNSFKESVYLALDILSFQDWICRNQWKTVEDKRKNSLK